MEKLYKSGEPYNCKALPSSSKTNSVELHIETMILSIIVEEIMNGDSEKVVIYSNNTLPLDCTRNFKVRSFNISGLQRVLPTSGIFAETENLLPNLFNQHWKCWMYVY